jgi:hypothetical protein
MAIFRAALAAAAFASLLVMMPAESQARARTDQVRGDYVPPKNPEFQKIYQTLKNTKSLEALRQLLSPLKLPRRLTLRIRECDGEVNAFYEDDTVTVCYEYLDYIVKSAPKEKTAEGITPKAVLVGATVDVFLHEVGHAVFDLLDVPVLGREEDAADFFSAYIILQSTPSVAHTLIGGVAYLYAKDVKDAQDKAQDDVQKAAQGDAQAMSQKVAQRKTALVKSFADEHGLPAQRYFNLLCIAYGSNPKTYADAITVGRLTKERAEGCEDEYNQIEFAIDKLIGPSIDQKLLKKVRAKTQLVF